MRVFNFGTRQEFRSDSDIKRFMFAGARSRDDYRPVFIVSVSYAKFLTRAKIKYTKL